jgi:diguanylate cyclase (GGDEF)-like protein
MNLSRYPTGAQTFTGSQSLRRVPIHITGTDLHETANTSEPLPRERLSVRLGRGTSVAHYFARVLVSGVDDALVHIVWATADQSDNTFWANRSEGAPLGSIVSTLERPQPEPWHVHAGGKITRVDRETREGLALTARRRTDSHNLPLIARVYIAAVIIAGGMLLVTTLRGGVSQPLALVLLLAMALLAALAKGEVAVLGSGVSLTAGHIADLLALLVCGTDVAILVGAFGAWTQCTFNRRARNPVHQTLFSVSALALSMGIAGLVYELFGGTATGPLAPKPFAAAITIFFTLNSGLVAAAVALTVGDPFRKVWMDFFLSLWPSYVIGAGLSAVIAHGLKEQDYWLVPLLAASLAVLHRNYQASVTRMSDGITDELTGLRNKRFAVDYVGRELARARRSDDTLAVALLDMNGFKHINDVGGHASGDRALALVATCLLRGVRASDLCARYGGDEFLIVLPRCAITDAKRRIEQIQADISASGREPAFPSELSVSAGIAMFPEDGKTFEALFAAADARMYSSKPARVSRIG